MSGFEILWGNGFSSDHLASPPSYSSTLRDVDGVADAGQDQADDEQSYSEDNQGISLPGVLVTQKAPARIGFCRGFSSENRCPGVLRRT
jgi:hypothetical protein